MGREDAETARQVSTPANAIWEFGNPFQSDQLGYGYNPNAGAPTGTLEPGLGPLAGLVVYLPTWGPSSPGAAPPSASPPSSYSSGTTSSPGLPAVPALPPPSGFVGPIDIPAQTTPSGTPDLSPLTGLSAMGSIFGSRRYRPSRLGKELSRLARNIGRNAVRGIADAVSGPPGEIVAGEPLPALPGSTLGRIFGVGGAVFGLITGTIWEGYPNALGSGELPKRGVVPVFPSIDAGNQIFRNQQAIDRDYDAITRPPVVVGPGTELFPQRPPVERERTIGEQIADAVQDEIGKVLNPPGWTPPPRAPRTMPNPGPPLPTGVASGAYSPDPNAYTAGPPAPTSQPPRNVAPPRTGLPRAVLPVGIALGGLMLIGLLGRKRGSPSPSSSASSGLSSGSQTTPQTGVAALLVGGVQGASSGGYCTPAPRGPKRKCLERAPVAWRAGRNKGKAAGSKCVRFAQRATR